MKSFRFKLQTVHDLREVRRDEAEQELAQIARRALEAMNELESLRCQQRAAEERFQTLLLKAKIDAHELAWHVKHLETMRLRINEQKEILARIEAERAEKQAALVEAARESEATAKLRAKELAQHKSEAARAEQKAIDEMAMLSFARRR